MTRQGRSRVVLNGTAPLAQDLALALQRLLAPEHISVSLGEM